MRGLLLKEYYNLRANIIIYIIMFALISVSTIPFIEVNEAESMPLNFNIILNSLDYVYVAIIFASSLILSSFSMDENSGWNRFLISEGTNRNKIIKEKYLLCFIFTLFGALLSLLVVIPFLKNPDNSLLTTLGYTFSVFLMLIISSMFGCSFNILFLTLLGVSKAIIFNIIIIIMQIIPYGIFMLIAYYFELNNLTNYLFLASLIILIIFSVIIYLVYLLTKFVFNKKEY